MTKDIILMKHELNGQCITLLKAGSTTILDKQGARLYFMSYDAARQCFDDMTGSEV